MNERISEIWDQAAKASALLRLGENSWETQKAFIEKFALLIVKECINREELLGAIARGWCSEKNEHKTMDSDLALAIFDEVERQIKQKFGVE
jgi:hypothetical protein